MQTLRGQTNNKRQVLQWERQEQEEVVVELKQQQKKVEEEVAAKVWKSKSYLK